MKKLIVTADDFGPHDFINQGIREAALKGCVNTISAIVTWEHCVDNIKQLSDELKSNNRDIKFGLHLSLTAGSPVLKNKVNTLVNKKGKFWDVDAYDYDRVNMFEVYNECEAQIKRFLESGIKLNHLSCHHGIMGLFPDFLKIYILLADKYNVPIRNPMLISREKKWGFYFSPMKREGLFRGLKIIGSEGIDQLLINAGTLSEESLNRKLHVFNGGAVKYPGYFVDTFYKNGSKCRLKKILKKLANNISSELVVHLGKGSYIDNEQEREKYNGINFGYFEGRKKELDTITNKLSIESYVAENKSIEWALYP